jgi:hypothetical protein
MVKTKKQPKSLKRKPRGSDATPPDEASPKKSSQTSMLVFLSIVAVVIAVVISFPPLTPLIVTAPVVPALFKRTNAADYRAITSVVFRWAISLFATTLAVSAFVPTRLSDSFPFAARASENTMSWLIGASKGAPAGYVYIVVGMAAFVVVSVLSVGLLGTVLWSIALGASAVAAVSLYAQGHNIVQITLIALPPWQIALFASALFALAPAAVFSRRLVFRRCDNEFEWQVLRRYTLIAGGLFALSLLLRLMVAGPYLALARHWTII